MALTLRRFKSATCGSAVSRVRWTRHIARTRRKQVMFRTNRWMSVVAVYMLAVGATVDSRSEAAEPMFRAGTALVDVTPPTLPVSMTGSFDDRQARRVE